MPVCRFCPAELLENQEWVRHEIAFSQPDSHLLIKCDFKDCPVQQPLTLWARFEATEVVIRLSSENMTMQTSLVVKQSKKTLGGNIEVPMGVDIID